MSVRSAFSRTTNRAAAWRFASRSAIDFSGGFLARVSVVVAAVFWQPKAVTVMTATTVTHAICARTRIHSMAATPNRIWQAKAAGGEVNTGRHDIIGIERRATI